MLEASAKQKQQASRTLDVSSRCFRYLRGTSRHTCVSDSKSTFKFATMPPLHATKPGPTGCLLSPLRKANNSTVSRTTRFRLTDFSESIASPSAPHGASWAYIRDEGPQAARIPRNSAPGLFNSRLRLRTALYYNAPREARRSRLPLPRRKPRINYMSRRPKQP